MANAGIDVINTFLTGGWDHAPEFSAKRATLQSERILSSAHARIRSNRPDCPARDSVLV